MMTRTGRSWWSAGGWRLALWGPIAVILLLPLIAMRFTKEVNWTPTDFLFAGVLLGGAALLFEASRLIVRKPLHRAAIGAALLAVVGVIWVDGAVGLF